MASVTSIGATTTANVDIKRKNGNVRTTKQGNPYYHTNSWKKLGAGIGLGATAASAGITFLMTKSIKNALITTPFILPIAIGLFTTGAIIDGLINHHEKKKADAMKAYNA